METREQIILCQPDSRKGCSICCGLFNLLDCAKSCLSSFLEEGAERAEIFGSYEQYSLDRITRDKNTHVCPYQGFLDEGKPGCLIHPVFSGTEGRDRSLFNHKICSSFLCPAHAILSTAEKKILIEHINDWFLYSMAIADPETFSFLLEHITMTYGIGNSDSITGSLLNAGLSAHAEFFMADNNTLFYYSRPEYILNREKFCIRYNKHSRDYVTAKVKNAAVMYGIVTGQ